MPVSPSKHSGKVLDERSNALIERIKSLLASGKLSGENERKANGIMKAGAGMKARFERRARKFDHKNIAFYVDAGLMKLEQEITNLEKAAQESRPARGADLQRAAWALEDVEREIDKAFKASEAREWEKRRLSESKKKIRGLQSRAANAKQLTKEELSDIRDSASKIHAEVASFFEDIRKRKYLHTIGTPNHMHPIFDKYPIKQIKAVHASWRKKSVAELAGVLGIDQEEIISLARALGWSTLHESLEWWREKYDGLEVGEPIDVTEWAEEGVEPLSKSKSRMIQRGLKNKSRIYAVPLYNGNGCLKKWGTKYDETLERRNDLTLHITTSPTASVAAWLCSGGYADTRNIGYDELDLEGTRSLEGIRKTTADALHRHLKLSENDTYVLMVRDPDKIKRDFEDFNHRIRSVKEHGRNARRRFYHVAGEDEIASVKKQTHPHIQDEVVDWYQRLKRSGELRDGVDTIMLDQLNP